MLNSITKLAAPLALSAMLMAPVASTSASAAMSFDPALTSQHSVTPATKVWWRGGGWRGGGWRGGWGYRGVGFGYRGYGWRGYGWRGGNWCAWHPRACY